MNAKANSLYISTILTPPQSPTTPQKHECAICKVSYKTKLGLTRHKNIIQKYNVQERLYTLPSEAISDFKAHLVYIIQSKLKGHFSQSGRQTISFPCLESLFFGVFKGYIHHYNYRSGNYKCLFQGPDTYTQVSNLFGNSNWGRKFFDNNQQTYIILFDARAEVEANQEDIFDSYGKKIPKNRLKKFKLPKLIVEWKYRRTNDAKDNKTSAAHLVYIIQSKLKGHFSQSGRQTISFPCLESLFFGVFKGYIHHYNYRSGNYKCLFQGPDTYTQVSNLFGNSNWGRKFFDNNQQTYIILFDARAEVEANQEDIFDSYGKKIPKNRLKKFKLPKLIVEWKYRRTNDAKDNKTSADYRYRYRFIKYIRFRSFLE
ncbi:hypothetical protein Glove_106g42 [Diversispora epigaea]|uniref:C2H2-type domain-containing protein n=1 Tax=Diversispora epigaea TaxID=1348612 RepID=A0A397J2W7_9GLOM|nr:hypothetical protein Glove_106g42 [Diversispora epigaea]